jgi:hypothetical protein
MVCETHSYSISNIIEECRGHCVSRSYQNYQDEALSNHAADRRWKGGLKVPKREIFDRSDFPDSYTIKSLRVGDFGV